MAVRFAGRRRRAAKVATGVACIAAIYWAAGADAGERRAPRSILYVDSSQLRIVRPDGTGGRDLARRGAASGARWCPDCRRILLTANGDLWTVRPSGGPPRRLTRSRTPESAASWSPDGRLIAFLRAADMWVMRADGSGVRRLTHTRWLERNPVWAPRGLRLAFVRRRQPLSSRAAVWSIDVAAGIRRRLAPPARDQGQPAWSPDATRLAFVRRQRLWTMLADGTRRRRLVRVKGRAEEPTWSPTGRWIAFVHEGRLKTVRPGGGRLRVLVPGRRDPLGEDLVADLFPVWSPDGRHLAFGREAFEEEEDYRGDVTTDLWTVRVRDRRLRRLTTGRFVHSPDWRR